MDAIPNEVTNCPHKAQFSYAELQKILIEKDKEISRLIDSQNFQHKLLEHLQSKLARIQSKNEKNQEWQISKVQLKRQIKILEKNNKELEDILRKVIVENEKVQLQLKSKTWECNELQSLLESIQKEQSRWDQATKSRKKEESKNHIELREKRSYDMDTIRTLPSEEEMPHEGSFTPSLHHISPLSSSPFLSFASHTKKPPNIPEELSRYFETSPLPSCPPPRQYPSEDKPYLAISHFTKSTLAPSCLSSFAEDISESPSTSSPFWSNLRKLKSSGGIMDESNLNSVSKIILKEKDNFFLSNLDRLMMEIEKENTMASTQEGSTIAKKEDTPELEKYNKLKLFPLNF